VLAQVSNNVEPFIDVKTILLALGLVTPFVTAVLTKASASDAVKSAVSGVVTALVAALYGWIEADELTWQLWFNGWVQILIAHAVSWLMFTQRPVAAVNANTPGVIGPSPDGH
jgi:hypothetical protein